MKLADIRERVSPEHLGHFLNVLLRDLLDLGRVLGSPRHMQEWTAGPKRAKPIEILSTLRNGLHHIRLVDRKLHLRANWLLHVCKLRVLDWIARNDPLILWERLLLVCLVRHYWSHVVVGFSEGLHAYLLSLRLRHFLQRVQDLILQHDVCLLKRTVAHFALLPLGAPESALGRARLGNAGLKRCLVVRLWLQD